MYGFGDDKQVANDTVNVMEEMLIEYIVDVVRFPVSHLSFILAHHQNLFDSVRRQLHQPARLGCKLKICDALCRDRLMPRN